MLNERFIDFIVTVITLIELNCLLSSWKSFFIVSLSQRWTSNYFFALHCSICQWLIIIGNKLLSRSPHCTTFDYWRINVYFSCYTCKISFHFNRFINFCISLLKLNWAASWRIILIKVILTILRSYIWQIDTWNLW